METILAATVIGVFWLLGMGALGTAIGFGILGGGADRNAAAKNIGHARLCGARILE